jgi:imidazoleglycerol-phosphate dehydratase
MPTIQRETRETRITLSLERHGDSRIVTDSRFLTHMLETLARYGAFSLCVEATGDLRHHLIEDVAIALGEAVRAMAADPVARFGDSTIPMDDALVHVSLDLGGRPYYRGPLPNSLYDHWMRSFSDNARATLHVRRIRGSDRHHVIEAAFKALGVALRQALATRDDILSTKGAVAFTAR